MVLRTLVLGLCLLVGSTSVYASGTPEADSIELRGSNGVVRLQMDTHVGAIGNIRIGAEKRSLLVDFKGVDGDAFGRMIKEWTRNPMISAARIQPNGAFTQLVLDFEAAVGILDETMVALDNDRTRLEIVLGEEVSPQGMDLLDPARPAPELREITVARKGDMVELAFAGSATLVAEVAFQDAPPVFIVDLPGIGVDQLQEKVDDLGHGGLPELVASLSVGQGPAGVSRLRLNLSGPADLVDSSGLLRQENSILRMQLVADRQAARPVDAQSGVRLENMSLERNRGRLEFVLKGARGGDIKAYGLEQPPRLMLDFLGWDPNQILDALTRFNGERNPGIAAVRYGESRLGSARVELELVKGVQLTDTRVRHEQSETNDDVIIAMDAPGMTQVLAGIAIASGEHLSGLDMRYSPAHDFSVEPTMVIQPLVLENSEQWAGARPAVGSDFDLLGLYAKALDNDAKYQAAKADYRANAEAIPQARAGYLPVAAFDAKIGMVRQNVLRASNASFPTGSSDYASNSLALTITQPVIRMPALVKMQQADVSVEQAKVNLLAAEQDLIMRVAEQYLNTLSAMDGVELAQAERESMSKQLELARTSLRSGLGTITALHDAEGRYALAQAKEITAFNEQDIARMQLKEIVGIEVGAIRGFQRDFAAVPPQPANVAPWVEAALAQNLALRSREMASEIAKLEIKRQRSGHLPTVDLVGSIDRSDTGGSLYGSGQTVNNGQLMLQLNMPLFTGGMTSSLVRESVARREQREFQKEEESRRTESLARASFIGVLTSAESLAALRKMVKAQESSLQGRLDGFKAGLHDIIDVIDGYRLYYAARRDYLKARYTYLVNRLRLKQSVGTLSRNDLEGLALMMQ